MIHAAGEIPTVMKHQYLLASFKGEAAALFEHTDLTANNYAITRDILNKRYDYKKALSFLR